MTRRQFPPKTPCVDCGQPSAGVRCRACYNATRPPPMQRTGYTWTERVRRKAAVDAWIAEHGYWCPGYGVPAHEVHEPTRLTADHIIPVAAGGPEDGPLGVLCQPCNSSKREGRPNRRTVAGPSRKRPASKATAAPTTSMQAVGPPPARADASIARAPRVAAVKAAPEPPPRKEKAAMPDKTPDPPEGAGTAGLALWRSVVDEFEPAEHELTLLREAVRIVDRIEDLDAAVKADGVMVPGPGLTQRVHPAVAEARQQRLALTRIIATLRVPLGDEDAGDKRPQRRGAARAPYSVIQGGAA